MQPSRKTLTGVEFKADEQHLRHHQADGLEGLRGKHEGETEPAHVDLPIGCHGCAQRYQQHRHYKPVGRVLQAGHKQRQHCDDRRERLHALAQARGQRRVPA